MPMRPRNVYVIAMRGNGISALKKEQKEEVPQAEAANTVAMASSSKAVEISRMLTTPHRL